MTVGVTPSVVDVMCSETNVTLTSLEIHRTTSSSDPRSSDNSSSSNSNSKESPTSPQPHHDADNPHPHPNNRPHQHSTTTKNVTLTSVNIQRTVITSSSDNAGGGGGEREGVVSGLTSSRRMSEHVRVVTFSGVALNDAGGIYQELLKKPSTASVDDSSKLVYQLSRELALLHGLLGGIGGESDSSRLRDELRYSVNRGRSLAQGGAAALVPLYRNKGQLKAAEVTEVEKLYRIFSGCLEYLIYLLLKIRSLMTLFIISKETCLLIQTGITDPVGFVSKVSGCSLLVREGPCAAGEGTSHTTHDLSNEDLCNIKGVIESMQQMLYVVNSACDVQPWDVDDVQLKSSMQPVSRRESRDVTFSDGSRRRQRMKKMAAILVTVLVIIAVAVTIALLASS